jgi:citrate lyase subunit beta/citryl-CoA lyase
MRSFLFVPADSERKLAGAADGDADALVLDLEDSVLPARKPLARQMLAQWMAGRDAGERIWVRVNEPGSADLLADLAAIVPLRPAGVVLPKITGPEDVATVSSFLMMAEAIHGRPAGCTRIIAICTETPLAVLRADALAQATLPRLAGLIWGGEDLGSVLGADSSRTAEGRWRPVYEHARTQCLLVAAALGILAIDTVYVDVRNDDGCRRSALEARADGFSAKVAIHPAQVPIINAAFAPTDAEIAAAERVIAAFDAGAGAVVLDGKMLDVPHLKAARRLLANAANAAKL